MISNMFDKFTKKEHIHVVRDEEAEEKGIEPGLYKDGEYYDSFEKTPKELVAEGKAQAKESRFAAQKEKLVAEQERLQSKVEQRQKTRTMRAELREMRKQNRQLKMQPLRERATQIRGLYERGQGMLSEASSRFDVPPVGGEEPPIKMHRRPPPEDEDSVVGLSASGAGHGGGFFDFSTRRNGKFDWSLGKSSDSQRGDQKAGHAVDLNAPSRGIFDFGSKGGSGSKFDFNVKSNMFSGVSMSAPMGGRQRKTVSRKKSVKKGKAKKRKR